jgi:hypothetical protein
MFAKVTSNLAETAADVSPKAAQKSIGASPLMDATSILPLELEKACEKLDARDERYALRHIATQLLS